MKIALHVYAVDVSLSEVEVILASGPSLLS